MLDVRLDHGAQRLVLQVRELRHHERVRVNRDSRLAARDSRVAVGDTRLAALGGWLILPLCGHNMAERKGRRKPALSF